MRGRAWIQNSQFLHTPRAQPQKANATLANPTNTNTNKTMTMTRTTKLNRLALVLVAALFVASLLLSTASADENSTASAAPSTMSDHVHTADGSTCYCCGSEYFSSCGTCKNKASWVAGGYDCSTCAGDKKCGGACCI